MLEMKDLHDRASRLSPAKRALLERILLQRAAGTTQRVVIPGRPDRNSAPLSFAQERLWFIDQLEPGIPSYNIPASIQLIGPLNAVALEKSLNEVVRRHEALRTT